MSAEQGDEIEYTPELGMEFWFEFDNAFNPGLGSVSDEVLQAYAKIRGPDFPRGRWAEHRLRGTYPDGFRRDMEPMRDALLLLADKQVEIFDRAFGGNVEAEQRAFEDFGQGVLYDERRPEGDKIHKMDTGGVNNPPIGYHRWHGFVRAVAMVGGDASRWLQMDRNVGLAWAIQSEAKPAEDDPEAPGLPRDRLAELREQWSALSFEELDEAFDSEPFPPGVDTRGLAELAPSGYDAR